MLCPGLGDIPPEMGHPCHEVKRVILSYLRTLVLYLVLILVIRLMGKRQIGQMEPAEFVVTMLVANLASIPMQDGGIPLFSGLVPILTVLGVELVLSWLALRSTGLRRLLCGKPVTLIDNGRLMQHRLRQARVTLDELMGHLRGKDVLDIRQVQFAVLETDGTLSVFPYPEYRPAPARNAAVRVGPEKMPLTLIEDGTLLRQNLGLSGKDEAWLRRTLEQHHARQEDTFLLALLGSQVIFIPREVG